MTIKLASVLILGCLFTIFIGAACSVLLAYFQPDLWYLLTSWAFV